MPVAAATARKIDHNGWYEIKANPISKVGVFPYTGRSIDSSLDPDKIYMVYRPAEELSHPDCIESFKLIPWIDMHPHVLLGAKQDGRVPAEQKGVEGIIGEDVFFENNTLFGNIKLFSEQLSDKIEERGIRELSAGYSCTYEISSGSFNGQPYDAIQRNIRGNHLASVPEGRMGPDVAVLDHKQLTFTMDAKEITMPKENDDDKEMKECADRAAKDGYKRYSKDAEEKEKEREEKEAADKAARDKAAKDKKAKDEDEDEDEDKDMEGADKAAKDKAAKDKAAKDAEEKEKDEKSMKDKKAMDAAAFDSMKAELEALRTGKPFFAQIAKRDELAGRVSKFVGAFDHSEMTADEVAAYGVKKLGLTCPQGSEMAALDGYMHGRKAPSEEIGYALDTGNSGGATAADEFYNTPAK